MTRITVRTGETLRDIAEKYLGDANLWTDILRVNNLSSATAISPGMALNVPANAVSQANSELDKANDLIQQANKNGARLFAPDVIAEAISQKDVATTLRKSGKWSDCLSNAKVSSKQAKNALNICEKNQNSPAEAVLNQREGNVQTRKSNDLSWSNAPVNTILLEEEKVRTLSQSYASILFRDESRLRLEQNSQALIQTMRVNKLKKTDQAKVKLIQGDIYALLGGQTKRNKFEVKTQGVETKINSSRFRVSKSEESTSFANYDGEIEVASGGKTITLKRNQGSIVRRGGKLSDARELLTQPILLSPNNNSRIYSKSVTFTWDKVKGAKRYWLEVALDRQFNQLVINDQNVFTNSATRLLPPNKIYYWRVAAVDEYGLPSDQRNVNFFIYIEDKQPPFLVINSPKENEILFDDKTVIIGETENEAILTFRGNPVEVDSNGKFHLEYSLTEGINESDFEAVDIAGNSSHRNRSVSYFPKDDSNINIDFNVPFPRTKDNTFQVSSKNLILSGRSKPEFSVSLNDTTKQILATTFADKDGQFQISTTLTSARNDYILAISSPTGQIVENLFSVELDEEAPTIELDSPIPDVIVNDLSLTGRLIGGSRLTVNGEDVALSGERFALTVPLKNGSNQVILVGSDQVGNIIKLEKKVQLDKTAPQIVKHTLSSQLVSENDIVNVQVYISDKSGLKQVSPFSVRVGEFSQKGYLKLSPTEDRYVGSVRIPKGVHGRMELESVILEDYVGNKKIYNY